jgi:hypothetical protein
MPVGASHEGRRHALAAGRMLGGNEGEGGGFVESNPDRVGVVRRVLIPTLALVLCACHSSTGPAATHPTPPSTSVTTVPGPTTTATPTSGLRTVLSSVGLHVRAQASKSAAILGTAAHGTTLTVLAHTDQGGGWFEVKGSTVTGWISDNRTLSAPGKFVAYSSSEHLFSALYPETWTHAELPPAGVVFRAPSGPDTVVVTTAASVAQLARGRDGYRQSGDEQIVVCGITGDLFTFTQMTTSSTATTGPGGVAAEPFLAQVHLTLDAQHALGIDANLGGATLLQTVRDFANSVTFPFPQCGR